MTLYFVPKSPILLNKSFALPSKVVFGFVPLRRVSAGRGVSDKL